MQTRRGLPEFENPPVVEVVLALQFDPIIGLCAPQVAEFWSTIRQRFPHWVESAPIRMVQERFGVPFPPQKLTIKVGGGSGVQPNRAVFQDPGGAQLLQLQQNCLVHNWRKTGPTERYPRYESIRESFRSDLADFRRFVGRSGLGEVLPTQCEVTYVNHVLEGSGWDRFGQLAALVAPWSGQTSDDFLGEPETVELGAHYVIRGQDGEAAGRLHIEVQPQRRLHDRRALLALTLTARGRPSGPSDEDIINWLNLGREHIVRGFTSFTSTNMHQRWGRKDAR